MPSRSGVRAIAPGYENPDTELIAVLPASPSRPETMADLERALAETEAAYNEARQAEQRAHEKTEDAKSANCKADGEYWAAVVGVCINTQCRYSGTKAAQGSLYCEAHR